MFLDYISLILKRNVASLSRVIIPQGVQMRYLGHLVPNAAVYHGKKGERREIGLETHILGSDGFSGAFYLKLK